MVLKQTSLVLSDCVCVSHEVQLSLVRSEDRPKPGVGVGVRFVWRTGEPGQADFL